MRVPRVHATATLLPDGRVLVTGGADNAGSYAATTSAELYNPGTNTWSLTAPMSVPRALHSASLLPNGEVLVAGGASTYVGPGRVYSSAEIFDPSRETWAPSAPMSVPRYTQTAVALPDGRIVVAGGWSLTAVDAPSLASAEIFDPLAGRWSATSSMSDGRGQLRMVGLAGGRVLVVGGLSPTYQALPSAEVFDPRSGQWSATGAIALGVFWPSLTALQDGRVLVAGGATTRTASSVSPVAELFLPPPLP